MKMIRLLGILFVGMAVGSAQAQQTYFQPYSTQGDNLIHVTTADFDDAGAKDYVVGMTIEGKVIAFQRPDLIVDPASATNRLWEYQTPCTFNIMIIGADAITNSPGDEVLVPGTDGHLRILSSTGTLLADWAVGSGALYSADVGVTSSGQTRIVTGGVDGNIYILNDTGTELAALVPPGPASNPNRTGVIRRIVAGNFDGIGGDEIISFYDTQNFSGGNFFEVTDLDTALRPGYWGGTAGANTNDVQGTLGWTDKQLPHAYDMDEDGDDELVANWGVLHPENGAGTQVLSDLLTTGERLRLVQEYTNVFPDTDTGKYLLQQGIPGNFRNWSAYPGPEMVTIYGDDLYLVDYDTVNEPASTRFRVKDYGYAHTLYHFTDGARLENRSSSLDKIVLAGPANGDDHFYVVNMSTSDWKSQAKTINSNGVLAAVSSNLDLLETNILNFAGTTATAGDPIWYVQFFDSSLGWNMWDGPELASRADGVTNAMNDLSVELFGAGYDPQRIHWTASLSPAGNGETVAVAATNGLENFAYYLAQRGAHFCLTIGKGANIYIEPDHLADIFEASVIGGHSYLMARTKELRETDDIDVYKPHMDAVLARAATLGVAPPKVMICGKGPIFSAMTPAQAATYFPAYKDVLVPGVENSNVTVLEWSFAERAGLWLNSDVESWGCNTIGDNLAANRIVEYGGMRNGHVVLRQMLSQYALGADVFRITSIQGQDNPLFLRDGTGPKFSSAYGQGIYNFLKLVEAGIFPNTPDRSQLKGVSPVAAALYDPKYARLRDQSINHDFYKYEVPPQDYVINNLACWAAYTDVPDVDLTAILHNTSRRWENLLPTSPSGFVPVVPYADRAGLEANAWCNRAYQTDGNSWSEFGSPTTARDTIATELMAQRSNQLFYVENECFWQVTQQKDEPNTLFAVLMDSDILSPTDRTVKIKKGSATGFWEVFDQFGSQVTPLGTLTGSSDEIELTIPAGAVRILTLQKIVPTVPSVIAIGWHTPEDTGAATAINDATPDTLYPGIAGLLGSHVDTNNINMGGGREWDDLPNSDDGTYGTALIPDPQPILDGHVRLRSRRNQDRWLDIAITNNTGAALGLSTLHFDYRLVSTNAGLDSLAVEHLDSVSDLTDGSVSLFAATGMPIGVWFDADIDLTAVLNDTTLIDGERAAFRISIPDNDGFDFMAIDNIAISIEGNLDYATWAAGLGLYGSNALVSVDLEPDGMENFLEYALGGDPTTDDAAAILPNFLLVDDLGTNWMEYVYRRRNDYAVRGLTYTVEANTNLVTGTWSTTGVLDAGSSPVDVYFDTVTNRVSTEGISEQFMRLRIEGN